MSTIISYALGLMLLLLGERIVEPSTAAHFALSGLGLGSIFFSFFQTWRNASKSSDKAAALKYPIRYGIVATLGIVLYYLTSDAILDGLNTSEDKLLQIQVVSQVAWMLLVLIGSLPYIASQHLMQQGSQHIQLHRVKHRAQLWLTVAIAFASLFPLNYIAEDTNIRWDLGYFKTTEPGTSTSQIIETLSEPLTAYLFFPSNTEVSQEIKSYFDQLNGSNFEKIYVDHALEPELAEELRVRENGYVVFTRGEDEARQTERLKVGKDFDSAKRVLKKLDSEVRESLLKLAKDASVIYVTTGHDELHWTSSEDRPKQRTISDFKTAMRGSNFSLKELSLANGLGSAVPEDAAAVLVLGPKTHFYPEEIETLHRYRNQGGSLMIALEPDGDPADALLTPLGLKYKTDQYLTAAGGFIALTQTPLDKRNLATNKFSTHASVTTLSRNNKQLYVGFAGAGHLEKSGETETKLTTTVRTLDNTWLDANGDLQQNADEQAQVFDLIIAGSGAAENAPKDSEDGEYRIIVTADTAWLSNELLFTNPSKGNIITLSESLAWLVKDESKAGTVNDEKDVKIVHSQEGQGWIFYGTVFLIPIGIWMLGVFRLQMRKNKGEA
ncbi:MAG: Gldg family protein [Myxococcota bacterium]